ncbi:hypothetical protein GCM10018779_47710 [Streptomyces griseocarneus]|nr:hypothetical protein GCM10018779_47710 [Streptomyces griseocarneus]
MNANSRRAPGAGTARAGRGPTPAATPVTRRHTALTVLQMAAGAPYSTGSGSGPARWAPSPRGPK